MKAEPIESPEPIDTERPQGGYDYVSAWASSNEGGAPVIHLSPRPDRRLLRQQARAAWLKAQEATRPVLVVTALTLLTPTIKSMAELAFKRVEQL